MGLKWPLRGTSPSRTSSRCSACCYSALQAPTPFSLLFHRSIPPAQQQPACCVWRIFLTSRPTNMQVMFVSRRWGPSPSTTSTSHTHPDHSDRSSTTLNLKLPPHTSIALVGASGSGKSTIASLILGLYPPTSGTLTFDALAISALHLPSLRSLIAVVPQTPQIFATTIALNIAYAMPERSPLASRANIESAAEVAGIHAFIASLPRGYSTLIGEGGTGLSGGQAQRIAIARAVARKPMLMVLDEATSALDGESARGIRELVARLRGQGVGVLMVTHDREMMAVCERVVVVKEGRVAETGGFEELVLRRGGELRRLLGGA
ncbi:ATP-dependent permease [Xanthoria parietina]